MSDENNQNRKVGNIFQAKPPRGLFSRVIRRLGLEKELLLVKKYLGLFTTLFGVFIFLAIFAFIGLKHVLSQSSIGVYLSLIFTDPGEVIKYWQSFTYSIFESLPGQSMAIFIGILAILFLIIKFASSYYEKLQKISKSIRKINTRHENRKII